MSLKKLPFFLLSLLFCIQAWSQELPKVKTINVHKLRKELIKDVQLVDVRTAKEFQEGKIGSAINIDVNEPTFTTHALQLDKTKPVYVYCRSGKRSEKAAQSLMDMGFNKVYSLKGGLLKWEKRADTVKLKTRKM